MINKRTISDGLLYLLHLNRYLICYGIWTLGHKHLSDTDNNGQCCLCYGEDIDNQPVARLIRRNRFSSEMRPLMQMHPLKLHVIFST